MRVAAPGDVRRALQVLDGPRPLGSLLEVIRQLGYDFLDIPLVQRRQTLANQAMEPGSAALQLALIENLTVQRMDEFIACCRAAVREGLRAHPFHNVMPAGQRLIKIFQIARLSLHPPPEKT